MSEILLPFLRWYLVTQLITVAALPLCLRYFPNLPDRGYAFARILGILLVSLMLWLGTSYGLLRNTTAGAWLSLYLVALLSLWIALKNGEKGEIRSRLSARFVFARIPPWRYVLTVELLFLLAFAAWTWVRAYDPAINHTEQPMDLMFMNGIWSSSTYPPRDPWLAGYPISYYYFGYWMLTALARFAGQPPEIAYNLGQACWFGLLFTGSFGIGYNLLRLRAQEQANDDEDGTSALPAALPLAAGLLTAAAVALTSNLHVILEWLYAHGARLDRLIRLVDVYNFPEHAQLSRLWYIDNGWSWWWRASRVIEDIDLAGNHIEIIDEFPIFSYILADNHPHLLAMPFVLLVIAIALNWFCADGRADNDPQVAADDDGRERRNQSRLRFALLHLRSWSAILPLGAIGLVLLIAATGALVFLNTWDFPPYLLLMLCAALFTGVRRGAGNDAPWRPALARAAIFGAVLILGALVLYLPYLLTAQSQAGGILPNLFHPTRLPQFLLMFGHFLLAVVGLLLVAWREQRPSTAALAAAAALVIGLPIIFLLITGLQTANGVGATPTLPDDASGYADLIIQRRLSQPWTFLLMGALLSLTLALLWQRLVASGKAPRATTFVLCLVAIGALLTYAPEFVYLRDNFGNRMNTVFKFYYQGWLLLAVAAAFAIAWTIYEAVNRKRLDERERALIRSLGYLPPALSFLLILTCLIYPVAGAYAKITGFGTRQPTLNGLAYIDADEQAAIDWIRRNTSPAAVVLQAKGASYSVSSTRISAATGRATLLGWDGHEAQWRGRAYAEMAAGRVEAVQEIYQRPMPSTLPALLRRWRVDYLLVGPEERAQYGVTPALEERLNQILEPVFEQGAYRIYRAPDPADNPP